MVRIDASRVKIQMIRIGTGWIAVWILGRADTKVTGWPTKPEGSSLYIPQPHVPYATRSAWTRGRMLVQVGAIKYAHINN
jgi:hypothetical protein